MLRGDESTAAHQELLFAAENQNILKGLPGVPHYNVFKCRNRHINPVFDMRHLRHKIAIKFLIILKIQLRFYY